MTSWTAANMNLDDPTTTALAASDALARAGLRHALYVGLVLAAFGEPRKTRDADFAVFDCPATSASAAMTAAGLAHQVTFDGVRFGGLSISRFTLLPGAGDTMLNTMDLVRPLSDRYAAAVLQRRLEGPLRGQTVALVSPEGLDAPGIPQTKRPHEQQRNSRHPRSPGGILLRF